MCGIVCFFGQSDGVAHVLEALHLLEYRAPDSSGLALIDESGEFALSRSVGPPARLVSKMASDPLYSPISGDSSAVEELLRRQALDYDLSSLRDLSPENGYSIDIYALPIRRCVRWAWRSRFFEAGGDW